jgi:hypothetical protein
VLHLALHLLLGHRTLHVAQPLLLVALALQLEVERREHLDPAGERHRLGRGDDGVQQGLVGGAADPLLGRVPAGRPGGGGVQRLEEVLGHVLGPGAVPAPEQDLLQQPALGRVGQRADAALERAAQVVVVRAGQVGEPPAHAHRRRADLYPAVVPAGDLVLEHWRHGRLGLHGT